MFALWCLPRVPGRLRHETNLTHLSPQDLAESVWQAQLFVLDSGTVAEVKSFPGRVIGWFLTIVGLLLVSVLVGIGEIPLGPQSLLPNPTCHRAHPVH